MKRAEKEQYINNMYNSLVKSWTYARFTEEEKATLEKIKNWVVNCGVIESLTTEKSCYAVMNVLYYAYLLGIGYTDMNWRDQ